MSIVHKKEFKKESKALIYPSSTVLGYAHIYSLGVTDIPVVALDARKCSNFKSRYVDEKYIIPDPLKDHEAFVDWLIEYGRKQEHKPVLFFAEDVYAYIASLYQDELKPYFLYPFIDRGKIDIFFNKKIMLKEATKTDINVPKTLFSPLTTIQVSQWKHYPALIKPLVSRFNFQGKKLIDIQKFVRTFGGKAVQISNQEELQHLMMRLIQENIEYCLQEYIPGDATCLATCMFVADGNGCVPSCFVNWKLRQQPEDFGTCCVAASKYIKILHDYVEQFTTVTKYTGPGGIEFKRNPNDQKWYFMEINPRSVFSLRMAPLNGVNLALQQYLLSTGQELFHTRQRDSGRYWIDIPGDLAGFRLRQKKRERRMKFWEIVKLYFYFNEAIFNWMDPHPGLIRMRETFLNVIKFFIKKIRGEKCQSLGKY